MMPAGSTIVLAFDNDSAGAKIANDVRDLAPGRSFLRHVPVRGKDWNDLLQTIERDYIRSLGLSRGSVTLAR